MKVYSHPTLRLGLARAALRLARACAGLRHRFAVSTLAAFGALALGLAGSPVAWAQAAPGAVRVDNVEVELVADRAALVPGEPMQIGLRIRHDPQWHTYWRNPGDSGLPTQVELRLPAGFDAGPIRWPVPQRLFIPPLANYGYEGEIVLPMALDAPASLAGGSVRLEASASWLMCREVCIPGEARLSLELPVQRDGTAAPSRFAALFDAAARRMPQRPLETLVHASGETLSIGLPGTPTRAEFFPYREGFVRNAAEQVLYAIDEGPVGARLAVQLSEDGVRQLREAGDALLAAAAGVVIVDGEPLEIDARAATRALPAGVAIARVAGAPAEPPRAAQRGGLLPGLGGLRAPSAGAAGGGVSPGDNGAVSYAGSATAGTLWVAALFGAIGGLILNLMPCVFPVIGLKVLGFARHGGEADASSRLGAIAFAAGVVVSFWALAALLLSLRAGGEAAGWGFQLQSPAFVASMALLFVAIGLNFSGVYEIGVSMTRLGRYDVGSRSSHPLSGSFGSGVLAVLVATPCTAPFMGSAMGYTLSSSPFEALVVFTAIALGMAAPYLLLGFFPQALRWLPRPGRWMETFRQALAFPMYATAAWLAWVLGQQAGIDAVFALAIGAVLFALAAWLVGRFLQNAHGAAPARGAIRSFAGALAAAAFALGVWTAWPADPADAPGMASGSGDERADSGVSRASTAAWEPWSDERVREARAQNRPVFVDFTAAWCVSCQVNKRLVLERESMVREMAERGVVRMQADWTHRDPRITEALARFGRNGVPLYLLYRPGEVEPLVLPELLTTGMVREALASLPRIADAGAARDSGARSTGL